MLVTGATGLLGGATVEELLCSGKYEVHCLVREGSPNASRLESLPVGVFRGDVGDEKDLRRALSGMDALVHVAGIEYTPAVLRAMRRAGVDRLVLVGSTSVHSRYEFRSGMRRTMEELVRGSGLRWTIVRPAMIYGSELDKNIHRLLRFLDRSPIFPMFGSGENLWQPVYYEDCARGVFEALKRPVTIEKSYDLPGAEPLTYRDLVRTAAAALDRKPRIVAIPLEPARRTLQLAETMRLSLPIKSEQVMRLREDKAYSYDRASRDLGYSPRAFSEGVGLEVARLREIGLLKP
ncbi:MAG TPA: NAD(P)H-binding protein [Rubrobacteraceae bacterium]|nr:NAD(P)H-binding protein [Rubrobacteraceae bacterium]